MKRINRRMWGLILGFALLGTAFGWLILLILHPEWLMR
jgi:hypothetical protein